MTPTNKLRFVERHIEAETPLHIPITLRVLQQWWERPGSFDMLTAKPRDRESAAAELRRLHAENESLRQIVEDFPPIEAELQEVSDRAHRAEAQRDALLEALKMVKKTVEENEQGVSGEDNYTYPYKVWTEAVREALAKAEGQA